MKKISAIILAVFMGFSSLFYYVPAFAAIDDPACAEDIPDEVKQSVGCEEDRTAWEVIQNVLNVIVALVGILAVLMIVISAILMATAAGDSGKIAKAKKGILYSVVGLAVAILSWAIINFVLAAVFTTSTTT